MLIRSNHRVNITFDNVSLYPFFIFLKYTVFKSLMQIGEYGYYNLTQIFLKIKKSKCMIESGNGDGFITDNILNYRNFYL